MGGGDDDDRKKNGGMDHSHQLVDDHSHSGNVDNDESVMLISSAHGDDDVTTKKRLNRKSLTPGDVGTPGKRRVRKTKKASAADDSTSTFIKYAALFLLVAQMVGLVLLMRYSRTVQRGPDEPLYLSSTAVFVMEVMKLVICLLVVAYQTGSTFFEEIYHHTVGSPAEIAKLGIPSILYTVQNNLLYLALTNLDAATYQVCYQLKILTTAIFSAVLLQRQFSAKKWFSLVVLTVGVAIVQLSGSRDQHTSSEASSSSASAEQHNRLVGLIAVLFAAGTSGFSGVYFEKILKGSTTSLWIRNVQMGLPSIVIAYITVYVKDAAVVRQQGFLGGYSMLVWGVVVVQAVGGLIVATGTFWSRLDCLDSYDTRNSHW
jgi:solute carrier family 35 (UDP-sugar transporter), member A1/2/3